MLLIALLFSPYSSISIFQQSLIVEECRAAFFLLTFHFTDELVCWRAPEVRARRGGRGRERQVGRKEEEWAAEWCICLNTPGVSQVEEVLNPPSSGAKSGNDITPRPAAPSPTLSPLQYRQSDSAAAYFSFLFIPIALQSPLSVVPEPPVLRSDASGRGKQPEVLYLSVIFHSPSSARHRQLRLHLH